MQYKITALKLNHIVYRKKRRGARLDNNIVPLKVTYNKKLVVFNNKKRKNYKIAK